MNYSILIYAARYAHTRNTGAAFTVVMEIRNAWDNIGQHAQEQIKKEAKEATFNLDMWNLLDDLVIKED